MSKMTLPSKRVSQPPLLRAKYYRSKVFGLRCVTLIDAGLPRARIHDGLLLFTLLGGQALVRSRGELHTLRPGVLLIVEPGEIHRDIEKTTYQAAMVFVRPETVRAFCGRKEGQQLQPVAVWSPELCVDLVALVDAARDDHPIAVQEHRAARVFHGLEPFWTRRQPRSDSPIVTRVQRALVESRGAILSLDELAASLRCAPNYLSRVFAQHVGVAPHMYQVLLQLVHARNLLENGSTVATAAAAAGFVDESHLHRHFRKRFAIPPGQFPKSIACDESPGDDVVVSGSKATLPSPSAANPEPIPLQHHGEVTRRGAEQSAERHAELKKA